MSAAPVIYTLLTEATGVLAIVPVARVYPVRYPEGGELPGLVVTRISSVQQSFLDAANGLRVSRDRVQVTALARNYPELSALVLAVDKACTYQRGVIAGITVYTITREMVGPDYLADERGTHARNADFLVTYEDPQ